MFCMIYSAFNIFEGCFYFCITASSLIVLFDDVQFFFQIVEGLPHLLEHIVSFSLHILPFVVSFLLHLI